MKFIRWFYQLVGQQRWFRVEKIYFSYLKENTLSEEVLTRGGANENNMKDKHNFKRFFVKALMNL